MSHLRLMKAWSRCQECVLPRSQGAILAASLPDKPGRGIHPLRRKIENRGIVISKLCSVPPPAH